MKPFTSVVILGGLVLGVSGLGQEPLRLSEEEPYRVEAGEVELVKTPEGRLSFLRGGVVITHGKAVFKGGEGVVYEGDNKAVLKGGVEIVDDSTSLTSEEATYFKERDKVVMEGMVRVVGRSQIVEADKIIYDRKSKVAVGTGHLRITDDKKEFVVEGEEGRYNFSNDYGAVYLSPRMSTTDERDPITISSDTMEIFSDGRSVARGGVLIAQKDWRSHCEKATYFRGSQRALLAGEPVLKQGEDRLKGAIIELFFQEGKVCSVWVEGGGEGLYHLQNNESNQIEGEFIKVRFENNEVERMWVVGDAKGVYRSNRGKK